MKKSDIDINSLVQDYKDGNGLDYICRVYSIGKLRAKKIIQDAGVDIRPKSSFKKYKSYIVSDSSIKKYQPIQGKHYVAVSKDGKLRTRDHENSAGILTSFIKNEYGIDIPTWHERKMHYMLTGNYWWEQWFDIILEDDAPVKKCPYCDWETIDIENKSGAFEQHIKAAHGITIEEHLSKYPEDKDYFDAHSRRENKILKLNSDGYYVTCPICGNHFEKLTASHMEGHGMTWGEFVNQYQDEKIMSNQMVEQLNIARETSNLHTPKSRFISSYEREIHDFLNNHGVKHECNRQILIGREIDILIEDRKIGIEFDGLKWHSEFFGKKDKHYHLNKTLLCNQAGYGLIHIFEDEYVNHKDIVYSKLSHILGLDYSLPKIMGRKTVVYEITKEVAESFLNKYHIQGFASSTVYLGCFHNDELVAVMSFKLSGRNGECELNRFATNYNYRFQGVGSKLFKYFVNKYNPHTVYSFADRRWTTDIRNNLYTNLGFYIENVGKPDYSYYNEKVDKFKRIHKFNFRKHTLHRKYGLSLDLTETEMVKKLGYDRIWNCGLVKYTWKRDS